MNLTWKIVTDELTTQGGIRRVVLNEKIAMKIGEGVSFSIPTGAIAADAKLKLFVGQEHTCPMELNVTLNGNPCKDADFGMDSYLYLNDPAYKYYTIATYTTTAANAGADAQVVTISGNPAGIIKYLELKIAE